MDDLYNRVTKMIADGYIVPTPTIKRTLHRYRIESAVRIASVQRPWPLHEFTCSPTLGTQEPSVRLDIQSAVRIASVPAAAQDGPLGPLELLMVSNPVPLDPLGGPAVGPLDQAISSAVTRVDTWIARFKRGARIARQWLQAREDARVMKTLDTIAWMLFATAVVLAVRLWVSLG